MVVGSPVTFLPALNFFHLLPLTLNLPGISCGASQAARVVKNPPANAGDLRDGVLISGLGRSPGGGYATHSSILAWRIPWIEELGGLQSIGRQRVRHN